MPANVAQLTLDELGARTGLAARTIRFYAAEGLLPPPTRRGRAAFYDDRHRLRLDLIRSLQEHGYTLAAIQRVLDRIPADAPAAVYAVQSAVLAPWLPEQREPMDRAALERRVGLPLTDALVTDLVQLGALERDGDGFRVSPATLGHAVELLHLAVPESVMRDSASIIEEHATAVAEGLTDVFVKAIWEPYRRGELTHEEVVAMLARLRPLAVHGLVSSFTRAADHAARRNLDG